jgi:hypothetical protein
MSGRRAKAGPLSAIESMIRWNRDDERARIGVASCVRWSCPADGLRFHYGEARATCKGCGDVYDNLGDRARRAPKETAP